MKRTKGRKDLKRGLDLFHRLYPSPSPPSPQPAPIPAATHSPRTEAPPALRRMLSEPTITRLERHGKDTERQLDEWAARPRRRRPLRLLSSGLSLAIPQQTGKVNAFTTSPALLLDRWKTVSAASVVKLRRSPHSPVYLNLPQLPFGAHKSYNEIPNMRSLLLHTDIEISQDTQSDSDDFSSPKAANKREISDLNRIKTEKIRLKQAKSDSKVPETEFPLFFSDSRRLYLAESEAVLTRRKFYKKKRHPQRYFKHIHEAG